MKKFFTNEVKIAVIAILALIVLFFGMKFLKGMSLFNEGHTYYAKFNDITGLSVSTQVFANGFKVGIVKGLSYNYKSNNEIVAELTLNEDLKLPKGSVAYLEASILGSSKVRLDLGEEAVFCHPGDTILGTIDGGALAKVGTMVPEIEKMLPKLDSILSSVNSLLADPALSGTLHNAEYVSAQLKTSTDQINTLLTDVNKQLPTIMQNANTTMANASNVTTKASEKLDQMNIEQTLAKVDATLNDVKSITTKINSGQGTLGALVNDKSLYNDLNKSVNSLNSTLKAAESLVEDLKAHPKRYVHFSVFGKKDKPVETPEK